MAQSRPLARCGNCAAVSITDQLDWAKGIACMVARRYHLRGQERDELIGTAHLTLCELEKRFDPSRAIGGDVEGAFRGWAYRFIVCACRREAERLRGGGTFHTIRPENLFSVKELGDNSDLAEYPDSPSVVTCRVTDEETIIHAPTDPFARLPGRTFGRNALPPRPKRIHLNDSEIDRFIDIVEEGNE